MRPIRPFLTGSLICVLFAVVWCGGCSRKQPSAADEVWVIGLDGADWDLIGPMMDRGELPNLAALRDGGASGKLRSQMPLLSPVVWTTIATGKTPDLHGITWFMTDTPDGTKVPVSDANRRVRAFWEIASAAGLKCGVVGWWATWPAQEINGFLVSDYVGWHSFGITGREATNAGKTWPPDLIGKVTKDIPRPENVPMSLVRSMVNLPPDSLEIAPGSDPYTDHVAHLRQALATTEGYTDFVLQELDKTRPALLAVYYEGTDAVQHLFGDEAPPRQPWISDADYAAYSGTVAAYFRWQDKLIGELLKKRGPRTTVLVVSDHGFRQGNERRKEVSFHIETADQDHMIEGVIIANGPDIRPGTQITGAGVADVAPTVLYLLGLPVGADMSGHVLTSMLTPARLAADPVRTVPTYETSPRKITPLPDDAEAGESMERMLRSLGYIAGGDQGAPEGGEGGLAAEGTLGQDVNYAIVLMRQGRLQAAADTLEALLAEHPGDPDVRLNLAQARARMGETDAAAKIYRGLLADVPDRMEAYEDYALMLGRANRPADALAVYDEGLARKPDWIAGLAGKGNALHLLGRDAEAERTLKDALKQDPRNQQANLYYGDLKADTGDLEAATQALERAHELQPEDPATALRLADVLVRAGHADRATAVLRHTYDDGVEDPALLERLGLLLMQGGKPADAAPVLARAVALDSTRVDALGGLGMSYAMSNRLPQAIDAFRRLVARQPDQAPPHAQLGAFYAKAGRFDDAVRELETAARLDPRDAVTRLQLGMAHHAAGRLKEAKADYEEALKLKPDLALAHYNLAVVEDALGDTASSRRHLERARQLDPSLAGPSGNR